MNRKEIEEKITGLVIDQLKNGIAPWRKPWNGAGFMPTSLQTGKVYRGVNLFMLSLLGAEYERSLWVTFKQAKYLGGHVNRGEKGLPVVYYSMINKRDKDTGDITRIPLLRLTNVFNVAQCSDLKIPAKFNIKREPVAVLDGVNSMLEKYASKPEIYYRGGDAAFYRPSDDTITLPLLEQFNSSEEYAHTLAHELVHSTSHESRLNRKADEFAPFGSANYAREELVADIGAQMVLSHLGVNVDLGNSASYLAGWLKALSNDPSMIIKASSDAQKAADYMLGIKFEASDIEEEDEVKA